MSAESRKNAKSIYLPTDVLDALGSRPANDPLSSAIARRLRRYEAILARTKILVSENELIYIAEALRGFTASTPDHLLAIPGLIKARGASGVERTPGVDPSGLAYRLEAAPFAILIAIVEAVERTRVSQPVKYG